MRLQRAAAIPPSQRDRVVSAFLEGEQLLGSVRQLLPLTADGYPALLESEAGGCSGAAAADGEPGNEQRPGGESVSQPQLSPDLQRRILLSLDLAARVDYLCPDYHPSAYAAWRHVVPYMKSIVLGAGAPAAFSSNSDAEGKAGSSGGEGGPTAGCSRQHGEAAHTAAIAAAHCSLPGLGAACEALWQYAAATCSISVLASTLDGVHLALKAAKTPQQAARRQAVGSQLQLLCRSQQSEEQPLTVLTARQLQHTLCFLTASGALRLGAPPTGGSRGNTPCSRLLCAPSDCSRRPSSQPGRPAGAQQPS